MPTPTPGPPPLPDPPASGDPAPPLDLPVLGGGRLDLAALRGGPVLVSFLRHAG
jgi:thioredoxin-dependent peroxiredoxin